MSVLRMVDSVEKRVGPCDNLFEDIDIQGVSFVPTLNLQSLVFMQYAAQVSDFDLDIRRHLFPISLCLWFQTRMLDIPRPLPAPF